MKKLKIVFIPILLILMSFGLNSCFDKSQDPSPSSEMQQGQFPKKHKKGGKDGCNKDDNQEEEEIEEESDNT